MESDLKIKRALIDTPGIKTHPQGKFNYTPEFLEKLSKDFRNQVVELDIHDSGRVGDVIKMGYCPENGLWADLLVPADLPEDDTKFSVDVQYTVAEEDENGVLQLKDGYLNKVVWSTPNGPAVRNPKTRLCNTLDGDEQMAEDSKIEDLNKEIGSLKTQLEAKDERLQSLEQTKQELTDKLNELKQAKEAQEERLQRFEEQENKLKDKLVKTLAGENEIKAKAYKKLSIAELQELANESTEDKKIPDTPRKGIKASGGVSSKPKEDDEKFTYDTYKKIKEKYNIK